MRYTQKGRTAFAVLLGMALLLAACSGQGNGGKPSAGQSQSPSTAPASAAATIDPSGKPQLPIVETPTELSWFVQNDSKVTATKKSYAEIAVFPYLEQETNIKINFNQPPLGMEQEQFNLMIASNELDDMIYWNWPSYSGGPQKALDDGIIRPLNDLIDQYAPHFKKFLEDNPAIRKDIMTDDGTIYAVPVVRKDEWPRFVFGFQLRQDWLDKVGLQVPTTMDEWHTVLKAFKEQNPGGTGNTIPFGNQTTKPRLTDLPLVHFMSAWGMAYNYYRVDGQVKFGPAQPEYKEFLATMKAWYDEGLIDPDFAATDAKQFQAKVTGNQLGSFGAALNGGMGVLSDLMKGDPSFKLVGAPMPKAPDGKSYNFHSDAKSGYTGFGVAISGRTDKAVEAIKWLDIGYSDWGNLLFNFGFEGDTYTMENGYPKYTDKVLKDPELPPTNALSQYTIASVNGRFFNQDSRYFEQILTYPQQKEASETWAGTSPERQMPYITPTAEESSQIASIMSEIYTYTDEMLLKFIMGSEPLDNFDAYLKRLEQMNIGKAVSIQQAALDRYNERQ